MAKLSTEELIAAFKELTLVELNDFVVLESVGDRGQL